MWLTVPVVSAFAAALAFLVGMSTLVQKARNDRRDAWWKGAQWAIDKALSGDLVSARVGTDAMQVLARAPGGTRFDQRILLVASARALDNADSPGDDEDGEEA